MTDAEKTKKFETTIHLPAEVVSFFAHFQEQGNLRYVPGDLTAVFEVEEADLWDAANTIRDVVREVNANGAYWGDGAEFEKAVEVEDFHRPYSGPSAD